MKRDFGQLDRDRFDLLVIGGGIYGAWVAYDAALRGLSVALVEQGDWSCGTSSGSSKLIHGGLRYLERLRLGLVRRGLTERRRLLELAPHRVQPLPMLLPLHRGARAGRLRLGLGLWLYDRLAAGAHGAASHRWVGREQLIEEWPALRRDELRGGFRLWDGQTDDARFTLEIVDGALRAGAVAVNRARVLSLLQVCRTVVGARVEDVEDGGVLEVHARATVNCAGPWAEQIVQRARPGGPTLTRLSKGVHLVLPALPREEALLLLSEAHGGVVFMLPWYGKTLVGTTDADFDHDPDSVEVAPEDSDYLLGQINRALDTGFGPEDVISSFAALRTLPHTGDTSPSKVTREMLLDEPLGRLLMPLGGKYTSARTDAVRIVDRVMIQLDRTGRHRVTTERPFPWKPAGDYEAWLARMLERGRAVGVDEETARNSCRRFGAQAEQLFASIEATPSLARRIVEDAPFSLAEVAHAAEHEMARSLEDILRRRIPLSLVSRLDSDTVREVAGLAGERLGWSESRRRHEVEAFEGRSGIRDHALG